MNRNRKPKVLFLDIETSNIWLRAWQMYDVNAGVNQIKKDWTILCWAAKWEGQKKVMFSASWEYGEKKSLVGMWDLMDEADIIVTQNGKKFDKRKLFARFVKLHVRGRRAPSPFQHIDTRNEARKHFGFTSNSLEYLAEYLGAKYKKMTHRRFPGQELWNEVEARNPKARNEMGVYCKNDVNTLESVYQIIRPWIMPVNFSEFAEAGEFLCSCGSTHAIKWGFNYKRQQRYRCKQCGNPNIYRTKRGKFQKVNGT